MTSEESYELTLLARMLNNEQGDNFRVFNPMSFVDPFPLILQNDTDKIDLSGMFSICPCSGDSIWDLLKKRPPKSEAPTPFLGELLNNIDLNGQQYETIASIYVPMKDPSILKMTLPEEPPEVLKCLRFLKDREDNQNMSIWQFIQFELNIEGNSGYDYLLMNYLETKGYIEHGAGIRGAWLAQNLEIPSEE